MKIITQLEEIQQAGNHVWSWIPGGIGNVVHINGSVVTVEYPGRSGQQSFEVNEERMTVRRSHGQFFIDLRKQVLLNDIRANIRQP